MVDTLQYSNKLVKAGVPKEQADAHAGLTSESLGNLATKKDLNDVKHVLKKDIEDFKKEVKGDIEDLRKELKGDIEDLRKELKGDIEDLRKEVKGDIKEVRSDMKDLESRLTIKLGGMIAGGVGLVVMFMKVFKI